MRVRRPPVESRAQRDALERLQAPSIEEQLKDAMPLVNATLRVRIARTIAQMREDSLLHKKRREVSHS